MSGSRRFLTGILLTAFVFTGCVQTIAVRTMGGIIDNGLQAFFEEQDLELAETALGGNLKLIEALVKSDPGNEKLLVLASQGYGAYANSFIEDKSPERARVLYLRARDYGLRALRQNSAIAEALDKQDDALLAAGLAGLSKDDVPAVFWTAFSWGSYINISRTDMGAMADLPKVTAMMEFVLKTDPGYFYGGAHMFLGAVMATVPPSLGGKPEIARKHFEDALALNGGRFLTVNVYYAMTYAVQVQDRELFDKLLKQVEDMPLDDAPEIRLPNAVAKRKARALMQNADSLF